VTIGPERRDRILDDLPELPAQKIERLASEYGIHRQVASQLVREGTDELFEEICARSPSIAATAASTVTEMFRGLERESFAVTSLERGTILRVFDQLAEGRFAKEALPDIFRLLCQGKGFEEALKELGVEMLETGDVASIIASVVEERKDFVRKKGMSAMGPLMGPVMERLRGRVDGKKASEMLRSEIEKVLEE
jgi:glutamyl-tRNA(Gln) amidotransferase subunit E